MDLLQTMAILVAVADGGSLSQASRQLKIPLASVSRKVSELETHLKVKLLTRTTRVSEFTDEGKSYVAQCRQILENVEEAQRTVTGEYRAPKGHLTLTAPVVFGRLHLVPIVTEFLKAYPQVDIQLVLTDRNVDLLEEKIDLAVRIGELPSSSLVAARIGSIRRVSCASPDYLKKHGRPKTPDDLQHHECVSIAAMGSAKRWIFQNGKLQISVAVHTRLEVTTSEAGLEAAALGAGITRALSYQVAAYEKTKRLEIVLKKFEPEPWPVHVVFLSGKIIPLKIRAFLDYSQPRLRKSLAI